MPTQEAIEQLAAELFKHRITTGEGGRAQCACGWWVSPLLNSVHRLHVAEHVLVEMHDAAYHDAQQRTKAVGLLLADSGDITPMGQRMLQKIWEPADEVG